MIKILIVDDSVFSQKFTSLKLKQYLEDVEFYYASDGEMGFEAYKKIKADFIFLDLLMPKLNGKDLIKKIKAFDSKANIIVLTADIQKNVKEEIEKYNILLFLNKPLDDEKAKLVSNVIRIENENKLA